MHFCFGGYGRRHVFEGWVGLDTYCLDLHFIRTNARSFATTYIPLYRCKKGEGGPGGQTMQHSCTAVEKKNQETGLGHIRMVSKRACYHFVTVSIRVHKIQLTAVLAWSFFQQYYKHKSLHYHPSSLATNSRQAGRNQNIGQECNSYSIPTGTTYSQFEQGVLKTREGACTWRLSFRKSVYLVWPSFPSSLVLQPKPQSTLYIYKKPGYIPFKPLIQQKKSLPKEDPQHKRPRKKTPKR